MGRIQFACKPVDDVRFLFVLQSRAIVTSVSRPTTTADYLRSAIREYAGKQQRRKRQRISKQSPDLSIPVQLPTPQRRRCSIQASHPFPLHQPGWIFAAQQQCRRQRWRERDQHPRSPRRPSNLVPSLVEPGDHA